MPDNASDAELVRELREPSAIVNKDATAEEQILVLVRHLENLCRRAADRLESLSRTQVETGAWRPIEEAKLDMRPVLLFEPGEDGPFGKETCDNIWVGYCKHPEMGSERFVRQGDDHTYVRATHYAPLPTPPEASS